ncbi:MAG: hypothetical protein R3B72_15670 [Polyangiaceae bacterium]
MSARTTLAILTCLALGACADDGDLRSESGVPTASANALAAVAAVEIPEIDPCGDAPACAYDGRCDFADDRCVAASEEACRRSLGCRDWGACSLVDGSCEASTNEDCRASYHCKNHGRCTAAAGRCVVSGNGDCRRSRRCRYHDQCEERGGRCVR